MNAAELREKLNTEFGYHRWPETYKVDAETYGYCCQAIFSSTSRIMIAGIVDVTIHLGRHGGLMFKNVELILDDKPK